MPTVCELKIEAKSKGLKGYSKMNKTQLQALVSGHKASRVYRPQKAPRSTITKKGSFSLYGTGRNPYD